MASGKSPPSYETCSTTKLSNVSFTYQWRVEKFIDFLNRQYEIPSQEFLPNPTDGSTWKLVLFTKHRYPEGPHLAASLVKLSTDGKPHAVKYTISLIGDNNYPNCMQTREKIFHQSLDFENCVITSHDELIEKKLLQHRKRPDLTIRCEMDILLLENSTESPDEARPPAKRRGSFVNNLSYQGSSTMDSDMNIAYADKTNNLYQASNNLSDDELATSFIPKAGQNDESLNALSDDLGSLYLQKKLTDVNVVAEGKSIGAHKAVLAARSDFFGTSNTGSQICVTGIRSIVMEAVLYYMYTGKTRLITVDLALDMLRAASRFRLKPLQKLTEDFLISHIQLENVIDVLELADELSLDDLKHVCLKFMSQNRYELELTEKWQVVLKKKPRIAGQVLLAIASVQDFNIMESSSTNILK